MESFTVSVILALILSISTSLGLENNELVDYRIASLQYNNRSLYGCNKPGPGCDENCRDVVNCKSTAGGLVPEYVSTCGFGTMCLNGKCVTPPRNPQCDPFKDLKFECGDVGVFPDPGDCKSYHMCVRSIPHDPTEEIKGTQVLCEGPTDEYGFNPKTGICDKKLTYGQCDTYPIPLCKPGGGGALTANPTFYYVCQPHRDAPTWLYPQQYRCDNGRRYSPTVPCKW